MHGGAVSTGSPPTKGITVMGEINRYLRERGLPVFNQDYPVASAVEGSVFVPVVGIGWVQ